MGPSGNASQRTDTEVRTGQHPPSAAAFAYQHAGETELARHILRVVEITGRSLHGQWPEARNLQNGTDVLRIGVFCFVFVFVFRTRTKQPQAEDVTPTSAAVRASNDSFLPGASRTTGR